MPDNLFFGGVPTGPDVQKLNETFHDLKIDDVIPYEDVEDTIGISRDQSRWMSVTNAWRKDLLRKGLVLDCVKGVSFKVANNTEVFGKAYDATKSAVRKLVRTAKKVETVEPENTREQFIKDHSRRILYIGAHILRGHQKSLAAPPTTPTIARIQPPEAA